MPPPNTPDESLPGEADNRLSAFVSPDQPPTTDSTTERRTAGTTTEEEEQTAPSQRGPVILPLDYQVLDYADAVDDTLLCPVCRTAFYSPIITSCGHTFCAACINRALEIQPTCPIDRKPINKTSDFHQPPLIIKDQLDRLRVKCPNEGCDHICSREHLEGHYEHRCEYTQVLCPSTSCNQRIARRFVSAADSHCLHREEPCQYCGQSVAEVNLDDHYDFVCSGASTKCKACEATVLHHRLEKHIREDCLETDVDCKWFPIGCKLSDKRFRIIEHEQECPYEVIGRLMKERAEDRKIIDNLVDRITALETEANERRERHGRRSRRQLFQPTSGTTDQAINDGGEIGMEELEMLRSSTSPEGYMLARFERLEGRMEDMTKQLQDLDAYQSAFVLQQLYPINTQLVELASKVGVLNMHTTWLMNMQRFQQRAVSTPAHPPPVVPSAMSTISTTESDAPASSIDDTGPHYYHYYRPYNRRNSDGREIGPPRL